MVIFSLNIKNNKNVKLKGSTAGGLHLVISGKGFSTKTAVTICGKSCNVTQANYSSLICTVYVWK